MKTIYKYQLDVSDTQKILMPKGAQILCCQPQMGLGCIWALVEPDAATEARIFEIFGTVHLMEERERIYVGTFQQGDGLLVWHVFELLSNETN